MRWRRRPTDRQLASWLATGQPEWVERWVDDPDVEQRLEQLSTLPGEHTVLLGSLVEPTDGFAERTSLGVQGRVDDLERLGVVLDLLSLGPRTVRSFIEPDTG